MAPVTVAGAPIVVERDNDKNPVVALREIADKKVASDDLREDFIHSMQKYVEVDEPEAEAVPMLSADTRMPILGQDDQSVDTTIDKMTEEELLRRMASQALQCGTALALIVSIFSRAARTGPLR
jgi:DNA-directed RNA polymerase subunit omega